jgi:arylsulfatase A-like enzyme
MSQPILGRLRGETADDARQGNRGVLLRAWSVLLLPLWCGVVAGLLEVVMTVLKAQLFGRERHFYHISRHFVWLIPVANLLFFMGLGGIVSTASWISWKGGLWLRNRLLFALTALPCILVAEPRLYASAWLLVLLGIASWTVPFIERHAARFHYFVRLTFPLLSISIVILAASVLVPDRVKAWRESSRPIPSRKHPNVLLIVLDTVRADHLNLYGYSRPTSPSLERLAERGVRFDAAYATAPWTLPSHASMFTGRWFHELSVSGYDPLDAAQTTLAEYLGEHGYATAGFVANTMFCGYDTGLGRGFTRYEDYALPRLTGLRLAKLVDLTVTQVRQLTGVFVWRFFDDSYVRKDAPLINRQFLSWLSGRTEPERPFFAFLNYLDAHAPYLHEREGEYALSGMPLSEKQRLLLAKWTEIDKLTLSAGDKQLGHDAYDDCLVYLDQQLGRLFDELDRHGVLEHTLVIITADHGENIGDHGLYDHGVSLYRNETRVPLVVLLPSGKPGRRVVASAPVSLRELPATIVDQVGFKDRSPFPGASLARFWEDQPPGQQPRRDYPVLCEARQMLATEWDFNAGRSPVRRGSMVSLALKDYVFIRNEGTGEEELYDVRTDPNETRNLILSGAEQPLLEQLRQIVIELEGGFPGRYHADKQIESVAQSGTAGSEAEKRGPLSHRVSARNQR